MSDWGDASSAAGGDQSVSAAPGASASLAILGSRIREERKRSGLSLSELSKLSEISVAMLSHIERGKTSPSLRSLDRIRSALGIPMNRLFPNSEWDSNGSNGLVVRKDRREQLHFPDIGLTKQKLSPTDRSDLEVLLLMLEPGGGSGPDPWARVGEKAGIVLRGRMRLDVAGSIFELAAGDSFQFDSSQPHRFENPGAEQAEIVWIIKSSPLVRTVAV